MTFVDLLWKDTRRELRSKESLQAGLVLVGLFFVLYLFAMTDLQDPRLAAVALWTPILYSTAALSARGMATEVDRGTIQLLLTAPQPRSDHGWSRTIVNLAASGLLTAFTVLLAAVGFGFPLSPTIGLIALLATIGLTVIGTLAGSLAAQARARELLTPILIIPVAAPLLQAGISATLDVLAGGDGSAGLLLMLGYDVVAIGIAWILWPFALEVD